LRVKDYNFHVRLFDPMGNILHDGTNRLKNSFSSGEGSWDTWFQFDPNRLNKSGDYRLVICENGIRQVDKIIKVVE